MNSKSNNSEEIYFQEILKQISTQSALIAGFAFAGLTMDKNSTTTYADIGFTICASLTMGLEILALAISGFLLFVLKLDSSLKRKWEPHYLLCWWSFLIGLISFLVCLPFIVYMRVSVFLIPVCIFACLISVLIFIQLKIILKKSRIKMEINKESK